MIVSQTGSRVAIYGVASTDSHAPSGHYRYTVGVKATEARQSEARRPDDMCSVHIPASDWLVFRSNFANLFGQLWQDNPYQLVTQLG